MSKGGSAAVCFGPRPNVRRAPLLLPLARLLAEVADRVCGLSRDHRVKCAETEDDRRQLGFLLRAIHPHYSARQREIPTMEPCFRNFLTAAWLLGCPSPTSATPGRGPPDASDTTRSCAAVPPRARPEAASRPARGSSRSPRTGGRPPPPACPRPRRRAPRALPPSARSGPPPPPPDAGDRCPR